MKILKLFIFNLKENLALIIETKFFEAEQYVEILYFRKRKWRSNSYLTGLGSLRVSEKFMTLRG